MSILRLNAVKHYTGTFAELPATLPYGDTYFATDGARYFTYDESNLPREVTTGSIVEVEDEIRTNIQGYYGLLSPFYFGGVATETVIDVDGTDAYVDVDMIIDAQGTFDNRVKDMKDAQAVGHIGAGVVGDPIKLSLEGLSTSAFVNFRASMSFTPDEDGGQLESRLLFERHTETSPGINFSIEEVSLSMQNGADEEYVAEPMLSFFVGDTIDTNGVGDAGKCRFQVRSTVAGTVSLKALTWYIHK